MSFGRHDILCYCIAGRQTGLGHAARCRTLLRRLGGPRSAAALDPDPAAAELFDRAGVQWLAVPKTAAGGSLGLHLAQAAEARGLDTVLLDCKEASPELVTAIRQRGLRVISVEDTGAGGREADLLIDPHVDPADAATDVPCRAERWFGPRFALLDPEFTRLRGLRSIEHGRPKGHVLRVAVSLGGSDPAGLTGRVLSALAAVDRRLRIDVVAGYGSAPLKTVPVGGHELHVHRGLDSLAELLAASDAAFVSGGITMFESACLGTPTVTVPQHDEQHRNALRLARKGALLLCPPPAGEDFDPALRMVARKILSNGNLRGRIAAMAAGLVDGRGLERLAGWLDNSSDAEHRMQAAGMRR